jgi:hypothetical protein
MHACMRRTKLRSMSSVSGTPSITLSPSQMTPVKQRIQRCCCLGTLEWPPAYGCSTACAWGNPPPPRVS